MIIATQNLLQPSQYCSQGSHYWMEKLQATVHWPLPRPLHHLESGQTRWPRYSSWPAGCNLIIIRIKDCALAAISNFNSPNANDPALRFQGAPSPSSSAYWLVFSDCPIDEVVDPLSTGSCYQRTVAGNLVESLKVRYLHNVGTECTHQNSKSSLTWKCNCCVNSFIPVWIGARAIYWREAAAIAIDNKSVILCTRAIETVNPDET